MNFLSSEKSLIIAFCFLFTISATFLFWQNKRELDPNIEKSWWTLSFAQPENGESLNFIIENHTTLREFYYEIQSKTDRTIFSKETVLVAPGETKIITPTFTPPSPIRTTISVTAGTEKKEIYR